jgi:hypothetical protein
VAHHAICPNLLATTSLALTSRQRFAWLVEERLRELLASSLCCRRLSIFQCYGCYSSVRDGGDIKVWAGNNSDESREIRKSVEEMKDS